MFKSFESLENADHYLSFYDMALLDSLRNPVGTEETTASFAYQKFKGLTTAQKLDILWENGMDTNQPMALIKDKHRTLQKSVAKCFRVVGTMRTDPEWLGVMGVSAHQLHRALTTNKKYFGM